MIRIHNKNAQVARFIPVPCRKKRGRRKGWPQVDRGAGKPPRRAATIALSTDKIQIAPSGIYHSQRVKRTQSKLRPFRSKPSPRLEHQFPFAATSAITNPIRLTATALSAYSAVAKRNNACDCSQNEHLMTRLSQPLLVILFSQRINMLPLG